MVKKITVERVLITTILIDVGDLIMLGATSLITGSILMFAQLLQGIANVTLDSFLLIGLKQSKRRKDTKHPLGYGRALYVWALFSTLIMFVIVSTLAIYVGWRRFVQPEEISNVFFAFGILAVSLCTNGYGVFLSTKRLTGGARFGSMGLKKMWKKYFSSTYVETKAAFITDFSGTLGAIVGLTAFLLFKFTGDLRFDGLGAIAIGVIEALLAFSLLRNVQELLIGKGVTKEVDHHIKSAALAVPGVEEVTELIAERMGLERLVVDIDVRVTRGLDTRAIQGLVQAVKEHPQRIWSTTIIGIAFRAAIFICFFESDVVL
jgi:cation diffusion facilitator family transporter